MGWIGLWDAETCLFDPQGLNRNSIPSDAPVSDSLLTRGTIMLETTLSQGPRPQVLLRYASDHHGWPVQISLQSLPGGAATLVVDQAGDVSHGTVRQRNTERQDALRITYCWDAPQKWGQLVMEHVDGAIVAVAPVNDPPPLRLSDLHALVTGDGTRFIRPDVAFLAVSSRIEPVGPAPSITARTPVLTPQGEKPICVLRRGDTVRTDTGDTVPVLHHVSRTVPARGSFAPVRLRAPYFGLRRDIIVAPSQRLKVTGSTVEYMFGTEAVLANASHLIGSQARLVETGPLVTYHQLILPQHEAITAAGTVLESLFVGRMRRKKDLLPATTLRDLDRNELPEHRAPAYPLLRPYDALVLAEQRSA